MKYCAIFLPNIERKPQATQTVRHNQTEPVLSNNPPGETKMPEPSYKRTQLNKMKSKNFTGYLEYVVGKYTYDKQTDHNPDNETNARH